MDSCKHETCPYLNESQIEIIAERAAEVALERVYTSIGKSVVNKVLWLAGAAGLAVMAWLNGSGHRRRIDMPGRHG